MNVTVMYELPVPVWVTCEALGETYSTGHGQVQFDVVMPQGVSPVGGAPNLDAVELPTQDPTGELLEWTTRYAAHIPPSLEPATALRRVVITAVEAPVDPARSWRTPDHALAEAVEPWFDRVRTWVEVLTGQDLDPQHRVYDAETVGPGLTFIDPPHGDSLAFTATTPRVSPVNAGAWEELLIAVRDGQEPPLEEVLSRDARAAARRGFYRRAIIDAAAALEVALARIVREREGELKESQAKRLSEKPTLGAYIDIARISELEFAVSFDELHRLKEARNKAIHDNHAAGVWETNQLVQIAIDFLSTHGLYQRTGDDEPDGSEWVVADSHN